MHGSTSFALLATATVILLLSSPAFAQTGRKKRQAPVSPVCLNPSGSDCSWYNNCLEATIPCQGSSDGYAIEFGEKYCKKFGDNNSRFSGKGMKWVDGVRKCLQVKLVPVFNGLPICSVIKAVAFSSIVPCYLAPGGGAPGICDLPAKDFQVILEVIFGDLASPFSQIVWGGLKAVIIRTQLKIHVQLQNQLAIKQQPVNDLSLDGSVLVLQTAVSGVCMIQFMLAIFSL